MYLTGLPRSIPRPPATLRTPPVMFPHHDRLLYGLSCAQNATLYSNNYTLSSMMSVMAGFCVARGPPQRIRTPRIACRPCSDEAPAVSDLHLTTMNRFAETLRSPAWRNRAVPHSPHRAGCVGTDVSPGPFTPSCRVALHLRMIPRSYKIITLNLPDPIGTKGCIARLHRA